MISIPLSILPKDIFRKADSFELFRKSCKEYLNSAGLEFDKFTIVSHDSFIGYTDYNSIQKCEIIKAGEKTKMGTVSQIDNFVTSISDYKPINDLLNKNDG